MKNSLKAILYRVEFSTAKDVEMHTELRKKKYRG